MYADKDRVFNVGLIGDMVSNDMDLIQQLKNYHHVTLIKQEQQTFNKSILKSLSVLVMDCTNANDLDWKILSDLRDLKKDFPQLNIVLIDGGITQKEIAAAFRAGIRDYFSKPYDINLLIERIQYLGNS